MHHYQEANEIKQLKVVFKDESYELPKEAFSNMVGDKIYIKNKKWMQEDFENIVPKIKSWNIEYLNLIGNKRNIILRCLHDVVFENLKHLETADNQIQSIECISRMHLPNIERLFIDGNKIASISIFKKGNWPNLNKINLSYNNIYDSQQISGKLMGKCLRQIYIETYNISYHQFYELFWLMKIDSNLYNVSIRCSKRLRKDKIMQVLGKKHTNLNKLGQ